MRNHKGLKIPALAFMACILLFPTVASAAGRIRVRLGGVYVGGFYSRSYYPYYGYYPYYAYYDPIHWGLWVPYYYNPGYYPYGMPYAVDNAGKIKLEGADKLDRVYLDGAYAGIASDLKTIKLKPGTYNLEVKHDGSTVLTQRVYVLGGKTVKVPVHN